MCVCAYIYFIHFKPNENCGLSKIVLPSQMTIGWNMIKPYISLEIFIPKVPYRVLAVYMFNSHLVAHLLIMHYSKWPITMLICLLKKAQAKYTP